MSKSSQTKYQPKQAPRRPGRSLDLKPLDFEHRFIDESMKIDHIGVATRGIEDAIAFYRDALGLEVGDTEEVADQKVRVAMLPIGELRIELLEATSADSPISRF